MVELCAMLKKMLFSEFWKRFQRLLWIDFYIYKLLDFIYKLVNSNLPAWLFTNIDQNHTNIQKQHVPTTVATLLTIKTT